MTPAPVARAASFLVSGPRAVLPGLTRYDIIASPLLAAVALAFLDAPEG